MGEIVVVPGAVVQELEDMEVLTDPTEKIDVLLIVVGSHIANDSARIPGSWCTCEMREIAKMPGVIVTKLEDMEIVTQEVDVLLEIVSALVAVERTLQCRLNHGSSPLA